METLKEEGIVVKALDSQWVPNARGDSWLRMKPDYFKELEVRTTSAFCKSLPAPPEERHCH
jgi:ATP-dependent DNA ligase